MAGWKACPTMISLAPLVSFILGRTLRSRGAYDGGCSKGELLGVGPVCEPIGVEASFIVRTGPPGVAMLLT